MKFLTAFFVLLISLISFPQADLDLTLTFITDEPQYNTSVLNFGLDSTATNGLDPWLGEFAYPPDGCGGPGNVVSCMAFSMPPPSFNDYYGAVDYRFGILPYSGQVDHRLGIVLGINATQAEMFWDFPEGVNVHLTDWFIGTFSLQLQDSGSYVFTNTLLNVFSSFSMIVNYNNVIPAELSTFTTSVLQNEEAIQLNWTTATETNNSGFEIQKTSPLPSPYQGEGGVAGRGWEAIGFVPGFGTTSETISYSFIDKNLTTGFYKYRLKQIDYDGTFEYSNEIEVEVDFTPKEFVLYQNYPNPFNPSTVISYQLPVTSNVTLKVYDVLGNEVVTLINEEKTAGVYEVEFDAGNLSSGIYFYVLRADNFFNTKKFVLIK